jgi:heterotetrameric sarcosine oxidase gamma subunit
MVDLSAFAIFDITGPSACDYLQSMAVAQMDVTVGRVVYTSLLNPCGGIRADLTIMRLAPDHYRVVTGGFDGMRDKKWFQDHLPADGSVQLSDLTSAWATLGVWGPQARALLQSITDADLSNNAFPFGTCRWIDFGPVRVLASRISYVGELGWELYVPFEQGARLWDLVWDAGQNFGVVPVGIGVYATTGRLEKGYRAYGNELEQEYNLVESGMQRPQVKPQDFIGKAAYLEQRANPPATILCTLTVDDPTSASGVKRYMLGREPVLDLDGKPLIDAHGRRSYVTSAGGGPSVGKHILLSYLPPAYARVGTALKVEYFGEHYPVTVAAVGAAPLFDPTNARMKA